MGIFFSALKRYRGGGRWRVTFKNKRDRRWWALESSHYPREKKDDFKSWKPQSQTIQSLSVREEIDNNRVQGCKRCAVQKLHSTDSQTVRSFEILDRLKEDIHQKRLGHLFKSGILVLDKNIDSNNGLGRFYFIRRIILTRLDYHLFKFVKRHLWAKKSNRYYAGFCT